MIEYDLCEFGNEICNSKSIMIVKRSISRTELRIIDEYNGKSINAFIQDGKLINIEAFEMCYGKLVTKTVLRLLEHNFWYEYYPFTPQECLTSDWWVVWDATEGM